MPRFCVLVSNMVSTLTRNSLRSPSDSLTALKHGSDRNAAGPCLTCWLPPGRGRVDNVLEFLSQSETQDTSDHDTNIQTRSREILKRREPFTPYPVGTSECHMRFVSATRDRKTHMHEQERNDCPTTSQTAGHASGVTFLHHATTHRGCF